MATLRWARRQAAPPRIEDRILGIGNGPGMRAKLEVRLFDPIQRRRDGLGLGMSICFNRGEGRWRARFWLNSGKPGEQRNYASRYRSDRYWDR